MFSLSLILSVGVLCRVFPVFVVAVLILGRLDVFVCASARVFLRYVYGVVIGRNFGLQRYLFCDA